MTEKYTPEKVAELVESEDALQPTWRLGMYGSRDDMYANVKPLVSRLADALTAVSAERDAAIRDRDAGFAESDHLSAKYYQRMRDAERVADVRRQTIATYERENAAWELQFHVAERERDRLHKAITEALEPKNINYGHLDIALERVERILRAALDKKGNGDD